MQRDQSRRKREDNKRDTRKDTGNHLQTKGGLNMADIELVVRMPEELYEANRMGLVAEQIWNLRVAINDGTLLPKGHGRLIDADTLKKDDEVTEWISLNPVRTGKTLKSFSELFVKKIDAAKTIIEADKGD